MKLVSGFSMLTGAMALFCQMSQAHVVLEQRSAPAGSSYRATFRVGHGCDGLPTTGIAVKLPPGVRGAKPMPKAGWRLATRAEPLAQPYESHGKTIAQDVAEVSWQAATPDAALPDAHYDEFVVRLMLPAQPGPLWFQVVQSCQIGERRGEWAWVQVPAQGTSTQGLKAPAVLLLVESAQPLGAPSALPPPLSPSQPPLQQPSAVSTPAPMPAHAH